jgi:hypothetical protein
VASLTAAASLTVADAVAWKLYDSDLALIAEGVGDASSIAAQTASYLELFGTAGSPITVTLAAPTGD